MQHATKLSSVRSRVASLSASLRIVQKRIENIDRLLAGYGNFILFLIEKTAEDDFITNMIWLTNIFIYVLQPPKVNR